VYAGPSKLSYGSKASTEYRNNRVVVVVVDEVSKSKTVDIVNIINTYRTNEYRGSPLTICSP
jgi:hypothetical protein